MFKEPYLYFYLIASFFSFLQLRVSQRDTTLPYITMNILQIIGSLGSLATTVFLAIGFWFMPQWWYPIAFLGLSLLTSTIIPIPDKIGAIIGIILTPTFSVLMFLYLFA
jgi:hypothetical protein